ncbi:Glycosyltransferase, GT2 family [Ekhidna lutea]|uniref:Glycosyltransferase, GT2 family n=1 Tax=Ekhidna lutea TaxID=447679 RepID=A0A239FQ74_EKHLU|nr:glycosyltransferase [Ekhidna lutea]SNS58939.1 Glycosyltransferase, GT2 family [Ekhidna lutea]
MKPLIAIGLGTKNRPKMLSQALQSLSKLMLPESATFHLIVCDNDPSGSASNEVAKTKEVLPFPVTYLLEAKEGIVFMRNKILEEAIALNAEYLAFYDDDEAVDPLWLGELFKTLNKYKANVVQGHVKQKFDDLKVDELIVKFFPGSFDRQTGDELNEAFTNNVLIDLSLVKKFGLKFNERFNLTGGSDSYFFLQLKMVGAKLVFCKDAIVTERIPETRSNLGWIYSRYYRNGYTSHLIKVERFGKIKAWIKSARIISKVIRSCVLKTKLDSGINSEQEMKEKIKCLRAKGMLHAMIGKSHLEYSITHGG